MRWLITGAGGMLGQDVTAAIKAAGWQALPATRENLDITDEQAVASAVYRCDGVINCAAYTAVDQAESDESTAFTVNGVGPATLAAAAAGRDLPIIHVSTDYVFDGTAHLPYPADGNRRPRSAYGRTKAAGEWALQALHPNPTIIRTAWLYGEHGKCFPKTIARVAKERGALDVVTDEVGQPTWTVDLADLMVRIIQADALGGVYHGTSGGSASWWDFARAIVESAGLDPQIVAKTTADAFDRPAPRPPYSVLNHDSLTEAGVTPIGDWKSRWDEAAAAVLAG